MTPESPLPRAARWLLRLSPAARRDADEVHADLLELFEHRRLERGTLHAHLRLYHDVASLLMQRDQASRPGGATQPPASLAIVRDARVDLAYAVRLFARQPAVLLLTVVGLSLGLGIATAAFSIMNAAALRGEGLNDPDRAPAVLRTTARSMSTTWAYDDFVHLRDGATRMRVEAVLTESAVVNATGANADAPSTSIAFVSGGFFAATGAQIIAGRALNATDDRLGAPPPVVISHVFWTSRLNQDPAVIGRTIAIGRSLATIVGVAARGFAVPSNRLLWMPLSAYGAVYDAAPIKHTPDTGLQVFGRLLPGVAIPEAEAQLGGVAASLPADAAAGDMTVGVRLDPHAGLGRVSSTDTLAITLFVFAVIALVLLLACANVATVLISNAITREREMGVRAALGASRGRIVRQLVTESLALGTVAAACGLVLTYWAIPMIATMIEAPADTDLAPDLNVYLFLGVVTVISGVGAGLAPAWYGRGTDLVSPLKGEGARQNRPAPRRLRSLLVITQAAVSLLLIVTATLFVRATVRATATDVGFDADGLYAVTPGLANAVDDGGAGLRAFWTRATADLQSVPGVAVVTVAELTPFGDLSRTSVTRDMPSRVVDFNGTRADYFAALGLRATLGRTYTADEVATRAPVVVISESLARAYWPGQSAVGQLLPVSIPIPDAAVRPMVIGVVGDVITSRLHERNAFAVYEPIGSDGERFAQLMIRVAPGTTGVIDQARQRLRAIDPQADIRIASIAARLEQEAGRPRMLATLTGIVGLVAIVLCVIGLYGLTASVVGQRAKEMAVRVAMGAERGTLLRLLMWDSLRPVVFGLAIGGAVALLASRVLVAAMFFGVSPQDPIAYLAASVLLLVSATLAVIVPTRRAAAVDAALVLRRS